MEQLGALIKKSRTEKNFSQRHLAELLNISNTELSNIEKGIRKKIDTLLLKKVSIILEINYGTIIKLINQNTVSSNGNNVNFNQFQVEVLKKLAFDKVYYNLKEDINFSSVEFMVNDHQNLYAIATTKGNSSYGFVIYYYKSMSNPFFNSDYIDISLEEKVKTAFVNFYFQALNNAYNTSQINFHVIIINRDSDYTAHLNQFFKSKLFFLKPYVKFSIFNNADLT